MIFTLQKEEHVMKRSRFTEEQIAFALKQAELGTWVDEICRKIGISDATFYKWRQKYGGLGPSRIARDALTPRTQTFQLDHLAAEHETGTLRNGPKVPGEFHVGNLGYSSANAANQKLRTMRALRRRTANVGIKACETMDQTLCHQKFQRPVNRRRREELVPKG